MRAQSRCVGTRWTGAKYYDLRSYTVAGGWQRLGGENLTGTTFSHTGLTAGTTYYYWVRGIRGPGNVSPWSTRMHATVPLPQSPTPTPTTTPTAAPPAAQTATQTVTPTQTPAVSPTITPTATPASGPAYLFVKRDAISVVEEGAGIRLTWTPQSRRNPLQHLLLPIR